MLFNVRAGIITRPVAAIIFNVDGINPRSSQIRFKIDDTIIPDIHTEITTSPHNQGSLAFNFNVKVALYGRYHIEVNATEKTAESAIPRRP
jgi:hypothetical protein